MITKISNGIILSGSELSGYSLYLRDSKILAVTREDLPFDEEINANGCYVAPGFVEIHTHGAGGYDFLDNTREACVGIARAHASHGTTSMLATVTSASREGTIASLDVLSSLGDTDGAEILGVHLEGPYFAESQKGAQESRFIRNPEREEYEEILSHTKGIVRWTAAPERPKMTEFADYMRARGVVLSIGHSDADSETAHNAFLHGFTHVTHLYSCTSTVHRRDGNRFAGIIEEAYLNDEMTVEIIADGVHLPRDLLRLVYKLKGADKIALVTDSMRGAGMPDGESVLGALDNGLPVIIEDGVAKLTDRSAFAGSVAFSDRLVRNMVRMADVPILDAVKMASTTPARIIGAKNKGFLKKGYDADVVIFDKDINVIRTIVGGKTVYSGCDIY